MLYRYLLFFPEGLFEINEFPILMEFSIACIGNQHRGSTRSVLRFLTYVISKREFALSNFRGRIDMVLQTTLEGLFKATFVALAQTAPSTLFQHLSELFFHLLSLGHESLQVHLQHHIVDPQGGASSLSSKEQERVMSLF